MRNDAEKFLDRPRYQNFCHTPTRSEDIAPGRAIRAYPQQGEVPL